MGRGLLKEFPNPERSGCPGADVLRRIASRKMALPEAEKWLDHLGSCSPCYQDFSQFQEARKGRRTRTFLAIAASILVVASVGSWALVQKHNKIAQTAVLDLRNRSVSRGTEPLPAEPPLEVGHNVSRLEIYLPLGSGEGPYDLRVSNLNGEALFTGAGAAKVQQGITSLPVEINLSTAKPGLYVLQLRRVGSEWNSYPLRIR